MKKILAISLAMLMLLGMISCAGYAEGESLLAKDDSAYVSMTMAELYEEAKKEAAEGKTLAVYSTTSSTSQAVTAFQEAYPDIPIEFTKYKDNALAELIPQEAKGTGYGDVVIAADSSGETYMEWYPAGYVLAYYPAMIEDTLVENYTDFGVPITMEADIWYYNTETFPDGAPVSNWWQVLEKNEDGTYKYKLASHPTSKLGFASDMSNMVLLSDELAQAYKDLYGTDLEYTYDASELGVEENNAGYEWLYRYLQADVTTFTDSDEVVEFVNGSTPEEPILGFCPRLKLDNARDAGFTLDYITDMAPFSGFAKTKYVYICTNTDNPAAARLFAFFALGGEDGKGAGYVPFVDREGAYPTISTFDASAINRFTLEELGSRPTDLQFVYDHYLDIQDFWTLYADKFMG